MGVVALYISIPSRRSCVRYVFSALTLMVGQNEGHLAVIPQTFSFVLLRKDDADWIRRCSVMALDRGDDQERNDGMILKRI